MKVVAAAGSTRPGRAMRSRILISAVLVASVSAAVAAQAPAAPQDTNPTGPLSLRDAVSVTLAQSPELRSFGWGRRAAEARQLQAGRRPNPIVSTTLEDIGAARALDAVQPQVTVQLSQLVELGGKRAARQRAAGLDQDLATWDYEAARLNVLTRVTSAFLAVLAAQQAIGQATEALDVAGQVQRTVAERVTAGVASPIEATRAGVLVASARIEVDRAKRTLDARRRQLATHWGSDTALFASATGALTDLPPIPPLAALDHAVVITPDVARWTAEIARRQAALALARAARVPDVTFSAGYRRFTSASSQAVVLGATLPLPWFDRNRDGIRAAEADLQRAGEAARAAQLGVRASLADAHRALSSAGDDVNTLRTEVLPGARSVFEAVREGYQLGRFGLMDVLDAQRTLVEANREYLDALVAYHVAATAVERVVGQPLAGVAAPASTVVK